MKRLIGLLAVMLAPSFALAATPEDPLYEPKSGDLCLVATMYPGVESLDEVLAFGDYTIYENYWDAFKNKDTEKIKLILKTCHVAILAPGTRVEVLNPQGRSPSGSGPEAIYVRPDEGEARNCYFWIERSKAFRRVDAAETKGAASSLLKSGQNLEKLGKKAGAIEFYSQVVNEFPGSDEAKTAEERIKALGGKVAPKKESKRSIDTTPGTGNFPRPVKRRYASQEGARQALDQAMGQMYENFQRAEMMKEAIRRRQSEMYRPGRPAVNVCGATTLDGSPCQRLVAGGGYCYQHRGY